MRLLRRRRWGDNYEHLDKHVLAISTITFVVAVLLLS